VAAVREQKAPKSSDTSGVLEHDRPVRFRVLNRRWATDMDLPTARGGLFALHFAEAVRAARMEMIVLGIMLAQQVLAVVVTVRGAHYRMDMIARELVVRIDDPRLVGRIR
jgi:hypothetical protein